MKQVNESNVWFSSFIVTGSLVGSGLLALPICLGMAGLTSAIIVLFLMWLMMMTTGLILANIINKKQDANFDMPSLFEDILGHKVKWIAIFANLIVLYGLLVVYLAGLTSILSNVLGIPINIFFITIIVFIVITSVNVFGMGIMQKANAIFVFLLFASFVYLVIVTTKHVQLSNFEYTNWIYLPIALPVVVNAFNYHNVIPVICRNLKFNKRKVRLSIVIGVLIGFLLNLIWTIAVLGILKVSGNDEVNITYAFINNIPATVPLAKLSGSFYYKVIAMIFGVVAITTSYWTIGAALIGFIRDLRMKYTNFANKHLDLLIAFLPPCIITICYPKLFIKAQDVVGGLGIALLFGFFPSYILARRQKGILRLFGYPMMLIFGAIFLFVLYKDLRF